MTDQVSSDSSDARTLTVDIGGSGTKLIILDGAGKPVTERYREKTPRPATPQALLELLAMMIGKQPEFDRVAVGFPGVVQHGIVRTAVNLDEAPWLGFDLQAGIAEITAKPVRVMNDADLQGYGVIEGRGLELVLTLGTGLGSALFINGHLVPNLELGHAPFEKEKTFEERVCEAELERIGKKRWRQRFDRALKEIAHLFNHDVVHIGGGAAKSLDQEELPNNTRRFSNVEGMRGGALLWKVDPALQNPVGA